jgi:rhodanese-related sulfurtransferase
MTIPTVPTIPTVSPHDVRLALLTRREVAILDLRGEDAYAQAHPLFAASLPLGRLEFEIFDRVPRPDTPIVLYDAGEGLVARAAERLAALGYVDVRALKDGLEGWRAAGYELFRDVNSASKAFGELVEARRHTPSIPAPEAEALIRSEPNLVVLDARRFEEYRTMSIPRGVSVPGAELVLRAAELAPDPSTTIVVNCAGRTRSIIGAQSLINAGLPNPVMALRNGTIGWSLAGQTLDHGEARRFPEPAPERADEARARARDVAYRAGVIRLTAAELSMLGRASDRTLYRFDVRTPEEFAAGHLPGFRSAPGGQLVQETDVFAPVRGARIVLADDRGVRADMTASWLAQMGWEVYVLDGLEGELRTGPWRPALPPTPRHETITAEALGAALERGEAVVLDLAQSPAFTRGHIPGAWFATRERLAEALKAAPPAKLLVLTSPDGLAAAFAARELAKLTETPVQVLAGGTAGWAGEGRSLEPGLRTAIAIDDVYRRPYEGADNPVEAMQAYLDWEYGLVEQLARDETHGFHVI